MKTSLSVSTLLACLALNAFAEKVRPGDPVVFQRSTLNTTTRSVTCVDVPALPSAGSVLFEFTLEQDCCDWSAGTCGNEYLDSWIGVYDGTTYLASNDDERCTYPCEYGPAVIGSAWGDGCIPAGTYILEVFLYSISFQPDCSYDYDGQDFTLCYEFCSGSSAGTEDQPVSFELGDAFPNPFNPGTTINFSLAGTADANLKVYNMAGAEVASLVNGLTAAGQHSVAFDGTGLTSGVYFYTLEVAGLTQTRKMVLVK